MVQLKSLGIGTVFLGFWLWFVPFVVLGVEGGRPEGWPLVIGGGLFLVGASLTIACVANFARRGGGTPAPIDPPTRLVVAGPYRWVRNPMYLGVGLLLLGEAVLWGSFAILFLFLVLAMAIQVIVVRREEPALELRFGEDYRAYRAKVSRWVPRRPR